MSKVIKRVKKFAPIILPALGTLAFPGVGTAIGGALGAGAGSAAALGGAVLGGLGGGISGKGLKGILTGAAGGGLGGALSPSSTLLGHAAGTPLSAVTGNSLLQGPTAGTGLKGLLGGGSSLLGGGGATGGGVSNLTGLIKPAVSLYSAGKEDDALEEAQRQLLASQGKATDGLSPYSQIGLQGQQQLADNLSEGFDPSGIYDDPSYQFRAQQGQDALSKSLAASGMSQSGAAMKAAQEYGQNLASTEYQNAYDRWLAQNNQLGGLGNQGLQAAGGIGNIDMLGGMNQADMTIGRSNIMSKTLADLMAEDQLGRYF